MRRSNVPTRRSLLSASTVSGSIMARLRRTPPASAMASLMRSIQRCSKSRTRAAVSFGMPWANSARSSGVNSAMASLMSGSNAAKCGSSLLSTSTIATFPAASLRTTTASTSRTIPASMTRPIVRDRTPEVRVVEADHDVLERPERHVSLLRSTMGRLPIVRGVPDFQCRLFVQVEDESRRSTAEFCLRGGHPAASPSGAMPSSPG